MSTQVLFPSPGDPVLPSEGAPNGVDCKVGIPTPKIENNRQ
jgi:hypothetical protein